MDMDRLPALTAAMQAAMRAGEPLTCDEATALTGVSPPPLDGVG
jgi:precorrin-3B methylase